MIRIKKENLIFLLIAALLFGVFFSGAVLFTWEKITDQRFISIEEYEKCKQTEKRYSKLAMLEDLIETSYYTDVDRDALYEGMYKGLFAGLQDPYSYYMNAEEYEDLKISTSGEFFGVGLTLSVGEDGMIQVMASMKESPAEQAGIQAGDRIVKVDGVTYAGTQLDEAVQNMRGTEGTSVTLTVLRGNTEMEYTLVRKKILVPSVKSELLDNHIAYIQITSFESHTADDFKEALRKMEQSGARGVIVDLRGNPGGLVDSAVEIADMLLPAGVAAYTQDRQGNKEYYRTKDGMTSLPYVLLIDGSSASASEILAAAVQDNQGGPLVGETSYGKGIIQSIMPLEDGSGGAVKMTVLQYFSAKGNIIHKTGIPPDCKVTLSEDAYDADGHLLREKDTQLQKAIELLKK